MEQHRENKLHIGFFGRCNVGKSTLVNTLTGQDTAIVSHLRGTTTDIVKKTMELYGYGPVVVVDTAGIDDDTMLAEQRKNRTSEAINLINLAVLVVSDNNFGDYETQIIKVFQSKNIPYVLLYNKQDENPLDDDTFKQMKQFFSHPVTISQQDSDCRGKLTKFICDNIPKDDKSQLSILDDVISKDDVVVLVTPIDSSAPQGRLILPQVKMIREVLDNSALCIVVKEHQLENALRTMKQKPRLVITDSQVFAYVNHIVPKDIYLTSFSILLAKEKGAFEDYLQGAPYLDKLQDGDNVLMLENCTHQPTCEDIGRVKLPKMITAYTKKNLNFKALSGLTQTTEKPEDFALVIQCGGCVATHKQLHNRLQPFKDAHVPVTNYGIAIAYMNGIFERACEIFLTNEGSFIK